MTAAEFGPDRPLLRYYALNSLTLGPFFWVWLLPMYFRFRTLRYRFDDEGVTMRWGFLFRKEITLTYARIQDIHLVSNVVERWMGLGRIQVQTASGDSGAEMTIEGLLRFEEVRDFLYARMRGARELGRGAGAGGGASAGTGTGMVAGRAPVVRAAAMEGGDGLTQGTRVSGLDHAGLDELTATLRVVAQEVRMLRASLESRPAREESSGHD